MGFLEVPTATVAGAVVAAPGSNSCRRCSSLWTRGRKLQQLLPFCCRTSCSSSKSELQKPDITVLLKLLPPETLGSKSWGRVAAVPTATVVGAVTAVPGSNSCRRCSSLWVGGGNLQ